MGNCSGSVGEIDFDIKSDSLRVMLSHKNDYSKTMRHVMYKNIDKKLAVLAELENLKQPKLIRQNAMEIEKQEWVLYGDDPFFCIGEDRP